LGKAESSRDIDSRPKAERVARVNHIGHRPRGAALRGDSSSALRPDLPTRSPTHSRSARWNVVAVVAGIGDAGSGKPL